MGDYRRKALLPLRLRLLRPLGTAPETGALLTETCLSNSLGVVDTQEDSRDSIAAGAGKRGAELPVTAHIIAQNPSKRPQTLRRPSTRPSFSVPWAGRRPSWR